LRLSVSIQFLPVIPGRVGNRFHPAPLIKPCVRFPAHSFPMFFTTLVTQHPLRNVLTRQAPAWRQWFHSKQELTRPGITKLELGNEVKTFAYVSCQSRAGSTWVSRSDHLYLISSTSDFLLRSDATSLQSSIPR
jgi:hypothetical protein